jgi:hypothetical protein
MFRVSLTVLVFLYLFLFLALVFIVWICDEWRRLRRERAALRHRIRCSICSREWEDTSDEILPRCPGCGTLNERWKLQRV